MTTDVLSEDRAVIAGGFIFARRLTATSSSDQPPVWQPPVTTELRRATADFCAVVALPKLKDIAEQAVANFAASVLSLAEVVAVTHAEDHGVHLVWSFIRTRDKAVRKEIYARERALLAKYRSLVFDFNVVALDQSDGGALVPDDLQGRVVMYRKDL